MLAGYSPFHDPHGMDQVVICRNIVNGKVGFTSKFNNESKDICRKLLSREVANRLGNFRDGVDDIVNHEWLSLDKEAYKNKAIKVPHFMHSLTYSLTHLLTYSLTHLLTYLLTHLLTHSLTYSLTHSLTHLLTHSLTHQQAPWLPNIKSKTDTSSFDPIADDGHNENSPYVDTGDRWDAEF